MPHADLAPTRRAVVAQATTLAGAVALGSGAAAASAAASNDETLLSLGRVFEIAWAEEFRTFADDAAPADEGERAYQRVADIVAKIEKLPATTLDGLILKARACSWCQSGEPFDDTSFSPHPTTDVRLVSSILRDLISIGGKPVFTS